MLIWAINAISLRLFTFIGRLHFIIFRLNCLLAFSPCFERIRLQRARLGFDAWVGTISWRRAWQTVPIFFPGESPWTEEPGQLQSTGLQRVRHDWATKCRTAPAFINRCLPFSWCFIRPFHEVLITILILWYEFDKPLPVHTLFQIFLIS